MEKLGKEARDKITGFKGIITGKITFLYGCDQYGITPKLDKEGKPQGTQFFDEGRVEIIGKGISKKSVTGKKKGGVNRDCPQV